MQDPVTLFGTRALVCTSRRDNERQWRHSLIVPRFLSRIEVQGGVKEDNNIELHSGECFISVHPRLLVHLLSRLFSVARRVSFLYTCTVSFSLSPRVLPSAALSTLPPGRTIPLSVQRLRQNRRARSIPSRAAGCPRSRISPGFNSDPLPCTREKSPRVAALWRRCPSVFRWEIRVSREEDRMRWNERSLSEEEDLWDEVGSDTKEEKEACFLSFTMFLRFGECRVTLPFMSLLSSLSFWIIENRSNKISEWKRRIFRNICLGVTQMIDVVLVSPLPSLLRTRDFPSNEDWL